MRMASPYVQKARAIVNTKQKLLPQRTHWASVAGILSAWLEKKDLQIAEQRKRVQKRK